MGARVGAWDAARRRAAASVARVRAVLCILSYLILSLLHRVLFDYFSLTIEYRSVYALSRCAHRKGADEWFSAPKWTASRGTMVDVCDS